jgi:hypothetical protein
MVLPAVPRKVVDFPAKRLNTVATQFQMDTILMDECLGCTNSLLEQVREEPRRASGGCRDRYAPL